MIPIQNVYYLLLYAWDALEEEDPAAVAAEPRTRILDLLGAVLVRGINRIMRQGLDRAYLPHREAIPGVRGKLDLAATIKADLFMRAQAICEFDDLSHDVLHNRILKATVRDLLRTNRLRRKLREPLRAVWHRLHDVTELRLTDQTFSRVQLHRNNRAYRFLLDA